MWGKISHIAGSNIEKDPTWTSTGFTGVDFIADTNGIICCKLSITFECTSLFAHALTMGADSVFCSLSEILMSLWWRSVSSFLGYQNGLKHNFDHCRVVQQVIIAQKSPAGKVVGNFMPFISYLGVTKDIWLDRAEVHFEPMASIGSCWKFISMKFISISKKL